VAGRLRFTAFHTFEIHAAIESQRLERPVTKIGIVQDSSRRPAQSSTYVQKTARAIGASRRTITPCLLIAISALLSACAGHQPRPDPSASQACQPITEAEVDGLFDKWNAALQTRDPNKVADTYAARSILLPTLSRTPRITREAKLDYFKHFLEKHPIGTINTSMKFIGCNSVVNAGTYTFKFQSSPIDDVALARYTYTYGWDSAARQWLITSHHSSLEPAGE